MSWQPTYGSPAYDRQNRMRAELEKRLALGEHLTQVERITLARVQKRLKQARERGAAAGKTTP